MANAWESATLKTSKKGHAYVQIPLTVANGRDQCGYPNQETVRLVAFADLAGQLSKTIRKGDEVRAEGTIKFERWNDKEGFQRTGLALIAAKVDKIGAEPVKQQSRALHAVKNRPREKPSLRRAGRILASACSSQPDVRSAHKTARGARTRTATCGRSLASWAAMISAIRI